MRRFLTLLGRELGSAFHQPLAYVVLFFFLLITGFNFHAGVSLLNRAAGSTTIVEAFFNTVYFWFPFVLVFPLITMRVFAEEAKLGTLETLMTAPVRDGQVVFSKYFGALFFYLALWVPSLLYFAVFQWITDMSAAGAVGSYLGAYSMLILIGLLYTALGCLASALTDNQIVAAVIAFAAILSLFFLGLLSLFLPAAGPLVREVTYYFSPIQHMMDFSRGIFDTRPVVFYISSTLLVLFATFHVFKYRRWKS
ncbi:MAG: ABC transporter permease [Terrimicrobiaceae bacterium]